MAAYVGVKAVSCSINGASTDRRVTHTICLNLSNTITIFRFSHFVLVMRQMVPRLVSSKGAGISKSDSSEYRTVFHFTAANFTARSSSRCSFQVFDICYLLVA